MIVDDDGCGHCGDDNCDMMDMMMVMMMLRIVMMMIMMMFMVVMMLMLTMIMMMLMLTMIMMTLIDHNGVLMMMSIKVLLGDENDSVEELYKVILPIFSFVILKYALLLPEQ